VKWFEHAVIRWQNGRSLMKRYYAQLHNGRRGRMSGRSFRTASQAKEYAGRWCKRLNRMEESLEKSSNHGDTKDTENPLLPGMEV
jgi:hypothetical protein